MDCDKNKKVFTKEDRIRTVHMFSRQVEYSLDNIEVEDKSVLETLNNFDIFIPSQRLIKWNSLGIPTCRILI